MNIHDFTERLSYMLKNETDGFMATVMEPRESGLPAYIIFNCYGVYGGCFFIPPKHKRMIVEVAKDIGGDKRFKRFNWNETIPVEVSESPQIRLSGKKLYRARALFSSQEWEEIFCFIARNRHAIKQHWSGASDSVTLFETVAPK